MSENKNKKKSKAVDSAHRIIQSSVNTFRLRDRNSGSISSKREESFAKKALISKISSMFAEWTVGKYSSPLEGAMAFGILDDYLNISLNPDDEYYQLFADTVRQALTIELGEINPLVEKYHALFKGERES